MKVIFTDKKVEEWEKAIGIVESIKNSDRECFAIQPKLINDRTKREMGTEFSIIYWINGGDCNVSRRYDCGWFTVEQLIWWIKKNKSLRAVKDLYKRSSDDQQIH